MAQITRLWENRDFRRFLAIALGIFLGNMIMAYGWGFSLTEDALRQDIARALGVRQVANIETVDVGEARILTFETEGQYGYVSYVRHPLLPLYKRTQAVLDYQPIATDGNLVVEDFSNTYLLGLGSGGLSTIKSTNYSSLGFDWFSFFVMIISIAVLLYLYNRFMDLKNQSDSI